MNASELNSSAAVVMCRGEKDIVVSEEQLVGHELPGTRTFEFDGVFKPDSKQVD